MSDMAVLHGELANEMPFFAPASTDMVDGLIGQYRKDREALERVTEFMQANSGGILHYFVEGNCPEQRVTIPRTVDTLFRLDNAIGQLNADYWNRALRLTDVLDLMPQKRRDEWFEQIKNPMGKKRDKYSSGYEVSPLPDFEENTVRATIGELLLMRSQFFAERVDGIFRALSGTHVTNEPQGFGKRMILAGVIESYGTLSYSKTGYINDLRAVVAKFMGRDEPKYGASDDMIRAARRNPGQWNLVDGGALRIRVYNGVGTAHLEVHPDMAWKLNCVLASLYPTAIPPKFRQKPAKKPKDFVMMGQPLAFAVVSLLAGMKEQLEPIDGDFRGRMRAIPNSLQFSYGSGDDKVAKAEAERVLESIGGVKVNPKGNFYYFQFDYNPKDVIDEIVMSGCVPHQKAHQFYPTPEKLARIAVEMACIGTEHDVLEPSAGIGGLADHIKSFHTIHCVEISPLHCKVLEAKGYSVCQADFLSMEIKGKYDRVICNPPYSEGRWKMHVERAFSLLRDGGKLVAILPASAHGKTLFEGCETKWSKIFENEFAGTSIDTAIMTVTRGM